jgi:hypothetical protein
MTETTTQSSGANSQAVDRKQQQQVKDILGE